MRSSRPRAPSVRFIARVRGSTGAAASPPGTSAGPGVSPISPGPVRAAGSFSPYRSLVRCGRGLCRGRRLGGDQTLFRRGRRPHGRPHDQADNGQRKDDETDEHRGRTGTARLRQAYVGRLGRRRIVRKPRTVAIGRIGVKPFALNAWRLGLRDGAACGFGHVELSSLEIKTARGAGCSKPAADRLNERRRRLRGAAGR